MNEPARAVVVTAPHHVEVSTVQLAELGSRDILIRTLFSGVSTGTDKWVMQGRFTWNALRFPLVPGYQRFGVIEALGSDVTGFHIGQEVVATASQPFSDADAAWGGHVSLAVSSSDEVYDATGIDPSRASLFVSAQVGFNAASRIPQVESQRVVVYGDGIIGVSGALAAKARGFAVLLVGRHPERMEPLADLDIEAVRSGDDSASVVRRWMPTAVIDTVQSDDAFDEYVDALPLRTGQIVFSGHSPGGTTAWGDMERMQQNELTASFVSGWTPDRVKGTLQLMRTGQLPVERFAVLVPGSEIASTMQTVAEGRLRPVAAVLDWRSSTRLTPRPTPR